MRRTRCVPSTRRPNRGDGYVSLEVSPYLAMNTDATIAEARRLWRAVGRDNLMIKVPATKAGLPAIRQLIGEGINVNITLLFSQQVYEAGRRGLPGRARTSGRARRRSRQGRERRQLLRQPHRRGGGQAHRRTTSLRRTNRTRARNCAGLRGKIAIANAKLAYQRYKRLFAGAALGEAEGQGRARAAAALGEHGNQESCLQRRALCGGADRRRHGQHDAADDDGRLPRPRESAGDSLKENIDQAEQTMAKHWRGAASRFDAVTATAGRGWRSALRRCLRQAARSGRSQARGPSRR